MKKQKLSKHTRILLKKMFADYTKSISLPEPYNYIYGNPIRPVVPLDVAQDGIFIIGAYPTARFATIEGERDVPIGDIDGSFTTEQYFDGSKIRVVKSGDELTQAYLKPLGVAREQCWITNLVKVFLFKDGHIKKYRKLNCEWSPRATRGNFENYARASEIWLIRELALARPRLILTLGSEVAGILQQVKGRKKRNGLLGGDVKPLRIGDNEYPAIHLAHPGITMRKTSEKNPWPDLHRNVHIPAARGYLADLLPYDQRAV